MPLSSVDIYYDTVNTILKKLIHNRITLNSKEEKELNSMLNQFGGLECYKEDVCNPDTCRFARIPDDWVKYIGYDNLCDLVYDYIKYGPDLNPPNGGDAMGRRMPGNGFRNQ